MNGNAITETVLINTSTVMVPTIMAIQFLEDQIVQTVLMNFGKIVVIRVPNFIMQVFVITVGRRVKIVITVILIIHGNAKIAANVLI